MCWFFHYPTGSRHSRRTFAPRALHDSRELIPLMNLFHVSDKLAEELFSSVQRLIPIFLLGETKIIFKEIQKGSHVSEKRMILHISNGLELIQDIPIC